jgi:5,6-dimethylbenzimidazole synthase
MTAFDPAFRDALRDLIVWRRDVRRFRRDALPLGTIERLLQLASLAPSVGLSQPWRFVVVEDATRRAAVRENFQRCNEAALATYAGERAQRYATLKLAGLDEAPVHLAAFTDRGTTQGHGLGRRTMPAMAEYSTVMAIHTMWLVARAEGLGLGWVSILDPAEVARILDVPLEWVFLGYFCLGYPQREETTPELEREAWEQRRAWESFVLRR